MSTLVDRSTDYFASMNSMSKKIVRDEITLKKLYGQSWNELSYAEQEAILDDHFIDSVTKGQYQSIEDTIDLPSSFPRLATPTNHKIVIEDDYVTWQDEHSGPFSWKSNSQQDLTLKDFDQNVNTQTKKASRMSVSPEVNQSPIRKSHDIGEIPWKPEKSIWENRFLAADRGYELPQNPQIELSSLSGSSNASPLHRQSSLRGSLSHFVRTSSSRSSSRSPEGTFRSSGTNFTRGTPSRSSSQSAEFFQPQTRSSIKRGTPERSSSTSVKVQSRTPSRSSSTHSFGSGNFVRNLSTRQSHSAGSRSSRNKISPVRQLQGSESAFARNSSRPSTRSRSQQGSDTDEIKSGFDFLDNW